MLETMDVAGFVALETAVWQALVDGDGEADAGLLAEEFIGVYPTGFAGRAEHAAQLAAGPTVRRFELSQVRLLPVADDAALLCYRAVYERASGGGSESMYVSSLWCRRDGAWLNVFSQDTPDTGITVV